MSKLFDINDHVSFDWNDMIYKLKKGTNKYWYYFTLYHSRFYAKANNASISKLCVADKYAICLDPWWFYLIRATLSGEIKEYLQIYSMKHNNEPILNKKEWLKRVKSYMRRWVMEHKDNLNDSWTQIVPIDKDKVAERTKCNYD